MHRRFAPFRVPHRIRVAHECIVFAPEEIGESSRIIYHHSIGTELTPHVVAHRGPKFLIYHNITPPEFFEPYSPDFAQILRGGCAELRHLARHFAKSAGVSAFNAAELRKRGFNEPMVLPLPSIRQGGTCLPTQV